MRTPSPRRTWSEPPRRTWRGSWARRGDTYESSHRGEEVVEGMVEEEPQCVEKHMRQQLMKKGWMKTHFECNYLIETLTLSMEERE